VISFFPLGGAGEIGASCFYLNIACTGIILDCGMHPQKTGLESLPSFDLIKNMPVDFVLISHAHQDHLGALPFLVKKHPYIKIITTPQTRAIAELTLHDSVSIIKEQIGQEEEFEIYSHEEIDLLIKSIEYKAYGEKFFISGYKHESSKPIKVVFIDAGHILGSAGILIEFNDYKLFYTGDINLDPQELLTGAELPKTKIDALIIEATYGSTDSSQLRSWKDEADLFAEEANKIINNGGSILIPVFALGKTQEILAAIWKLMEKRKLIQTDIYTGGLGSKLNRVYDYNRYVVNYSKPALELRNIPQKNLFDVDNYNEFFKTPSIILASSGMMLEKTTSFQLGKKWLAQSKSAIFTVGYMEESTPGYRFSKALKGNKIQITNYSRPSEVKCTIKNFRFGSHSKREGLLEIVKTLNPSNAILIHGDSTAIDWVGATILKTYKNTKVLRLSAGRR
jgi:cleavage and polyadenylation specificity factor subunit 3